ncbi:MAG: S-methyl-5'-thioinosine phosphorylase [Actinomycetota bacterium]
MLAIITGSGFTSLDGLHEPTTDIVETPYGQAALTSGRWQGGPSVVFVPRHGPDHGIAPHAINYRANIWAIHEAGASGIVATAVSGGIAPGLEPGTFVVIDDFIDFTSGRQATFFDEPGNLRHTDVSEPYDPALRALIESAARSVGAPLIVGGTYCTTNGPRFETRAEIEMMRRLGGDLVGMTGCPEVVLAAELAVPYASIGVISNRAAGLAERELSVPEIMDVLAGTREPLERIIDAVIGQLPGSENLA